LPFHEDVLEAVVLVFFHEAVLVTEHLRYTHVVNDALETVASPMESIQLNTGVPRRPG
jgi:hypothetical protein